jgi:photosystem II stability/assembly factor-like uncharacterized protein
MLFGVTNAVLSKPLYPALMRLFAIWSFPVCFLCSLACAQWQAQDSHTHESLRGVSASSDHLVWASGTHGTYVFTRDGGRTWTAGKIPGAESLDFRGVKSFGVEAFLLAAGPGEQSRIYHTSHLGEKWDLQFTNPETKGFFDCIAFSDRLHGIVVGDPVNGRFRVLQTSDGGKNWQFIDPQNLPPAIDGEGAFAASNSCVAVQGKNYVWFVTGGTAARVFRSIDGGKSWLVSATPIMHGSPSQGIFSIAFRDASHGVIAGGDYQHPEQNGPDLATTDDGGKTWKLAEVPQQKFFSAIAYAPSGTNSDGLIAVGASASAFSKDNLHSWESFSPAGFNAVVATPGLVYAVGANGSIAIAKEP